MKLKSLILLAALIIGGGCSCDCEDYPNYYDVTGINADTHILAKRLGNQTESEYLLAINEKVDYDKLIIRLKPSMTYYGERRKSRGFSFVNSAYACKCSEGYPGWMGSKEQLSEIKIYSDTAFNPGGHSSDLLNQYFEIADMTGDTYDKFFDIDALLATKPLISLSIRLRLKAKPTGSLNHKFTIHYKLTNGEFYTATTQEIIFN
ncbi:MAG: hypothetical protein H7Y13_01035 [Sphingobacteriaceae bacterium]|nr:hypothetical protein [Sphingobacteriaceae bacterium]